MGFESAKSSPAERKGVYFSSACMSYILYLNQKNKYKITSSLPKTIPKQTQQSFSSQVQTPRHFGRQALKIKISNRRSQATSIQFLLQISKQGMSRRPDKCLVKLYKDLLISKRELIDLRQSVSKTLYGLNQPHAKNPTSILAKKKICLGVKKFSGAAAQHCKPPTYKCPNCALQFPTRQSLQKHQTQNHHLCRHCYERYNQHPFLHEAQLCGETRLDCEKCGAKVRRKDINQHVMKCCFNSCPKCKKLIYYKSYSYHLHKCQEVRADPARYDHSGLTKTKKLFPKKPPTSEQIRRNMYIPCSMQK